MQNTVKKESDVFKYDLSKEETSYTYYLEKANDKLNDLANDPSISHADYVKQVLDIISPAKDTPAKRKFIFTLQGRHSKVDAMFYVTNARLNGTGHGVI